MTQPVTLPGVEAAASWATERLCSNVPHLALTGRTSAGKSRTLELLRDTLSARGMRPIMVAPPIGSDAAPVAMMEVATGLSDVDDGLLGFVKTIGHPWSAKLDRVREALAAATRAGPTVLLVDEPWLRNDPVPTVFTRRAQDLTMTLTNAPQVRTIVASTFVPPFLRAERFQVEAACVPSEVLDRRRWNGLGDAADRLLGLDDGLLRRFSPLELQLAVALVAAGVAPRDALAPGVHHRALIERLLGSPQVSPGLRKVVGRLAVCRTRFREPMLEAAGQASLDQPGRAVLHGALLSHRDGWWRLHGALAREARERRWLNDAELDEAHARAAGYYRAEFEQATQAGAVDRSIRHELEVIHHLTEAGDVGALDQIQPYFVEQWDALGRSLSLKRRFPEAVRAYERALSHDPEDSYAHHYVAFNLDIQGREAGRVEAEYRAALEREPTHPWYHARHVCFLIARGRTSDARVAWGEALERIFPEGAHEDFRLYEEAHRQVARLLLHRGELAFAREVLEDVPPRHHAPWHAALVRLLISLEEAEKNHLVFPPHLPVEERWSGPHLIRDPGDLAAVKSWTPARVAKTDEDALRLRIAQLVEGEVRYGWRDVTRGELKRLSRYAESLHIPAGTFVELITLKQQKRRKEEVLLVHPRPPQDPALPGLFMEPDRYIRNAAQA